MWKSMVAMAWFTLLEARRNHLLWLAAAVALTGLGLALFLGEVAITESRQIRLSFLSAFFRLASALLMAGFVLTSQIREAGDKGQELLLSMATPRAVYFFGKLAGFAVVGAVLAIGVGWPLLFWAEPARVALWGVSLTSELVLISAWSLFAVLALGHMTAALGLVAGLYVLSRSMRALRLIAAQPLVASEDGGYRVYGWLLEGIALVLPRLDSFTRAVWLWEPVEISREAGFVLGETVIYGLLICGAALFDLYRKEW